MRFLLGIGCLLLTFATSGGVVHVYRSPKSPMTFGPPEAPGPGDPVYRCDKTPELPLPIQVLLNRNFPGWDFPEVSDDDCYSIREFGGPEAYAQLIKGDFNDDGRLDYAVLIQQRAEANDRGVARPLAVQIVAFFRKADGYKIAG